MLSDQDWSQTAEGLELSPVLTLLVLRRRVAKKDTFKRSGIQFVSLRCVSVDKHSGPKDTKWKMCTESRMGKKLLEFLESPRVTSAKASSPEVICSRNITFLLLSSRRTSEKTSRMEGSGQRPTTENSAPNIIKLTSRILSSKIWEAFSASKYVSHIASHTLFVVGRNMYVLPMAGFMELIKHEVMKDQGYQQGQLDHTIFFKQSNDRRMTILIVYVDDIILTRDNTGEVERLKKVLATEFEVKDLGQMRYFLGIEVARSRKGISISQRKYVLDLLTETCMLGCKPRNIPIKARKGTESDGKPVDRERYQRLVGRLIYLSHTGPDIAFVISLARLAKDRRSTTGYCTHVWGNLVTWRSKKQSVIARSSVEVEFKAVAQGMCEGLWLQKLLEELHITVELPIKLYCDNKVAISISHNPVQHDKIKHIEVDGHFIKEKIEKGTICMTYIPTREQLADIFTKGLQKFSFKDFICKLDMINIYDPT
uniref:Reverse transcriptase Ty1/copia-type domain-containing protein n=2 Tax=Vitis vinifera TaxID=29760 RepID=A5ALH4_VITVI|nr:hypothetical protein VITISV_004340 [Vitis vinifera]